MCWSGMGDTGLRRRRELCVEILEIVELLTAVPVLSVVVIAVAVDDDEGGSWTF